MMKIYNLKASTFHFKTLKIYQIQYLEMFLLKIFMVLKFRFCVYMDSLYHLMDAYQSAQLLISNLFVKNFQS